MYQPKTYDLIVLANHPPSRLAEDAVKEYSEGKGDFTEVEIWRVTNNYALKNLKRKFKFEDLPCFVITTQITKTRKRKDLFYSDEIEEICRGEFREAVRKNAKQIIRETKARSNLGLRVSNAKSKINPRDVFPAAQQAEKDRRTMSDVCAKKKD